MAKDYAKRVFTTTKVPGKKRRRQTHFFIPTVLLIVLAVFFAFVFKMSFHPANGSLVEKIKLYFAGRRAHSIKKEVVLPKKVDIHHTLAPQVHFDFYNALPQMKPNQIISETNTREPTKPQYVVQLGQFQTESEASQNRLTLLLSGFEASIVKLKSEKGIVYQIQRGPFSTESEAKKVQKKLLNKGITSEIKKI